MSRNEAEAIATAKTYVARGHSVDMGLGQINSKNMRWLGLTWETVFKPCVNLEAAGSVLLSNYRSVKEGRTPQRALRVALSMYNTGSTTRGFRNGYVARIERAGRKVSGHPATGIPRRVLVSAPVQTGDTSEPVKLNPKDIAAENRVEPSPPPPSWDVFARAAFARSSS